MKKPLLVGAATVAALLPALLIVWFAARPAAPKPYADAYRAALAGHPGSRAEIDVGLARFTDAYRDLSAAGIDRRIASLYAPELYFNDTLKTFRERAELARYMAATGRLLETGGVEVEQVVRDGADVFVRWRMQFESAALGREFSSDTVGMTHLRFDQEGRVVLHQDFRDPAAGLFRHVPVVGYVLDAADRRISPSQGQ